MNVLTTFVTSVLHPILENTIRKVIETFCQTVVDVANKAIAKILHPNSTHVEIIKTLFDSPNEEKWKNIVIY